MKRFTFSWLYPFAITLFIIGCSRQQPDPPPPPPAEKIAVIETGQADGLREDTAVILSTLTLNDDPRQVLEAGICYDSLPNPDITKHVIVSIEKEGAIFSILSGLHSQSTYYARAWYKNSQGVVYGKQVSFRAAWHPEVLGNYYFNGAVQSLASDQAGNLFAGGAFVFQGADGDFQYLAKFDGANWTRVPGMVCHNAIEALTMGPDDEVYAGTLDFENGFNYIMKRFDGGSWSNVGIYNNLNWRFTDVTATAANEVYTIGEYAPNGYYYVSHWKDGQEEQLGNFKEPLLSICSDPSGNVYVAGMVNHGYIGDFGSTYMGNFYVAKWDGTSWTELGRFNDLIERIRIDRFGNLLVAGAFTVDLNGNIQSGSPFYNAGPRFYIAKYDGTNWSKVGDFPVAKDYGWEIQEMETDPAGNIYVSGTYRNANGRFPLNKFDGSKWTEVATFPGVLYALHCDKNGMVYAAGNLVKPGLGHYIASCAPKLP